MSVHVVFQDLGTRDYQETWDYQEILFNRIITYKKQDEASKTDAGVPDNYLLFVEHPHVYTLGKSGSENNLLINHLQLQAKHAQFIRTNRGGDITYHGPGQIVGYPILDLERLGLSIREYIFLLEESVINMISGYGLKGGRLEGATGVWLEPETPGKARKICAIGVRASRHTTMHGFALNVNTNLEYFRYINPCGFVDKQVTSIRNELGKTVDFKEARERMKAAFFSSFKTSKSL